MSAVIVHRSATAESSPEQEFKIAFCHLPVSKLKMRMNASFNVSYRFRIDASGSPSELEILKSHGLETEPIAECLQEWTLPASFTNEVVVVVQRWEHGTGWEHMSVFGDETKLVLTQFGNPLPYHSKAALSP